MIRKSHAYSRKKQTSRYNTCDIRPKVETLETCIRNTCKNIWKNTWKTIIKHTQHPDKTLTTYVWNICNIQISTLATYVWKNRGNIRNRSLQYTCRTITTNASSRSTSATSVWNSCNMPLKHLKHLKYILITYIFHPSFPRRSAEWWMGRWSRGGQRCRGPYGVEQMGQRGQAANELSHLDTKHRQNAT
jgi:hypothetical protein